MKKNDGVGKPYQDPLEKATKHVAHVNKKHNLTMLTTFLFCAFHINKTAVIVLSDIAS